jgi:hypothetical protein
MLEHHRDARGARGPRLCRGVGRVPFRAHRPRIGPHQPVDHLDERRLARAVFAQKRVDLAGGDGKRHVVIGHHAGIGLGQPLDLEECRHALMFPRPVPVTPNCPSDAQLPIPCATALSVTVRPHRRQWPGGVCRGPGPRSGSRCAKFQHPRGRDRQASTGNAPISWPSRSAHMWRSHGAAPRRKARGRCHGNRSGSGDARPAAHAASAAAGRWRSGAIPSIRGGSPTALER